MLVVLALACLTTAPARAQVNDQLPFFEALEQQQRMSQQRALDDLEARRQRDLADAIHPGSGISAADRALIDQHYDRSRDQLLLEAGAALALKQRERDIATAGLPNARIPPSSSLLVNDPLRFGLPPAPEGQYYARVDDQFVLVDRTSELVVSILPSAVSAATGTGSSSLQDMTLEALPPRRIASGSVSVISDYASHGLSAPPAGQYYALIEGFTVLVDGRTELPVKLIRSR